MKLLLVVGLAAVVIVILIAVFLSVRLGRGDDHDHEEPVRPGSRDRGRRDDEDARWRDAGARDSRRQAGSARAGGSGRHPRDGAGNPPDRDRDGRRSRREQAGRDREQADRDYDYPERRDAGRSEHPSGPRRAAASGARRPGTSREYRDRPDDGRRDQRGNGPMDYPEYYSGPQRGYAGEDFLSGPLPVTDFHSGEYPSMDFPSGPLAAADYPSVDFPSGPLAAAGYPSGDSPAVPASTQRGGRSRSKSGPGKNGSSRGQPESRRKPAKAQSPAKGRSRSKRDDDDDWPSTEWDKLTDEQYWAELSSDKPLSMARPAQPASEPAAAGNRADYGAGNGTSRPANGKPKDAQGALTPAPASEPARELPSRRAPSPPREPVTERLPVRARPQPPVPARAASGIPATSRAEATIPRVAEEPSLAMLSSLASGSPARPYGALDEDPLTSPSFARPPLDSRSYQQPSAPAASGGYDTPGYGNPSYHPDSYRAGTDYPSTDYPRPAYPASGYGSSGPHSALPASPVPGAPGDDGYLPPQAGPGHAYPSAPQPQAAPASWHQLPDEPMPAQGNPYGSYVDPAPPSYQAGPAVYADSHPSGGHAYLPDLAGRYSGPGFSQAPAPYQPAVAAAHPADAGHYPAASVYPPAGYSSDYGYEQHASQAPYPGPQEAASYPPGYANGHPADPYQDSGYGYPAAQG